ncbi:MAG: class A beta-lactamase [Hyphomonadaceae bacterium]
MHDFTRRTSLLSVLALAACQVSERHGPVEANDDRGLFFFGHVREVEARVGGRVGVAALNTADGFVLSHRANERFAMCSMFKWLLAAQMLYIDMHAPGYRDQSIPFGARDLEGLGHTPVTRANLARGSMTVEELARAAVVQSDNGAANLLMAGAGGPEGLTRFLQSNGDADTRLDRIEPELNQNLPGDERDTTTPSAMVNTMNRFLLSDAVLNQSSRERLISWLVECETGLDRLRGGLPADWRAGDKTGTSDSEHNATTDVAIAWPPGRAPIIIACFLSDSTIDFAERKAAHAEIARYTVEGMS